MTIGQRLRDLREKAGWNQNQLAHQSNVPRQVIARIEAGQRDGDNMTVSVAKRLARALHVSVDHLIGMYDEDRDMVPTALVLAGTSPARQSLSPLAGKRPRRSIAETETADGPDHE